MEESESNNEDLKAENDSLGTQITSLDSQLASAQQSLESANEAHQVSLLVLVLSSVFNDVFFLFPFIHIAPPKIERS